MKYACSCIICLQDECRYFYGRKALLCLTGKNPGAELGKIAGSVIKIKSERISTASHNLKNSVDKTLNHSLKNWTQGGRNFSARFQATMKLYPDVISATLDATGFTVWTQPSCNVKGNGVIFLCYDVRLSVIHSFDVGNVASCEIPQEGCRLQQLHHVSDPFPSEFLINSKMIRV